MSPADPTPADAAVSGGSVAAGGVRVRVDDAGIHVAARRSVLAASILDVFFDERRIYSFWPLRDTDPGGHDHERLMPWPKALLNFLDGSTRLRVAVHGSGDVWFDEEVRLQVRRSVHHEEADETSYDEDPGDARHLATSGGPTADVRRIAIVDKTGHPLALDKSWRRVRTFETRTAEQVAPLMDAIDEVLTALRRAGIEAFLAYGTLLGAVREGALIGHDSDADLGYVSEHSHPVDVMLESFRLQRALTDMGYPTARYSGAAFKVEVREADGSLRGLDVFGGFLRDGNLHLMGEIRTPFRREWVFPLGTATLEGREFPVPADTERFLVATYGPHWRTPDPAFKFETPESTHRRLNGWFRGIRVHRGIWDAAYAAHPRPASLAPSDFARWVLRREPDLDDYVDVGCGHGVDARWVASQGRSALGLDHAPKGYAHLADQRGDLPVDYRPLNLLEVRSFLSVAAAVAHRPGTRRVVAGRHLLDALDGRGRRNFYRAAEMMTRGGGRVYLEFLAHRGSDGYHVGKHVHPLPPARVRDELVQAGATVLKQRRIEVASNGRDTSDRSVVSRMVATWQ